MRQRLVLIGSMVSILSATAGIVWAEDLRQIREQITEQAHERLSSTGSTLSSGGITQRTIQERIRITAGTQAQLTPGPERIGGQARPELDVQVNRFDGRTGAAAVTAQRPEINRITVPKSVVSAANADDFIRR